MQQMPTVISGGIVSSIVLETTRNSSALALPYQRIRGQRPWLLTLEFIVDFGEGQFLESLIILTAIFVSRVGSEGLKAP